MPQKHVPTHTHTHGRVHTHALLYLCFSFSAGTMLKSLRYQLMIRKNQTSQTWYEGSFEDEEEDDEDFHVVEIEDMPVDTESLDSSCSMWDDQNILGLEEFDFSPLCDLKLSEGSILLNISQIQELCQQLPANLSLCEWRLTFRTQTHGTSLRTLYKTSSQLDACSVLIIRDSYRQVFGVVCSAPLRVSTTYYGTGQTFVFSFSPHLQVYKWTGGNSFFIKGSVDSLHFGGGRGRYGLWINGDLIRGRSQTCETFDNEVLSSTEDFLINELEVWTLV